MLVSLRHRLVLLAMPKCASTSLEAALAGKVDVVISKNPSAKHTPFRKYDRFLRRYFETFTDGPLEVVSLFREPEDWLRSWWRYRSRPGMGAPGRSVKGWSFERFALDYINDAAGPASVGSQARFVSAKDDTIGCDRIFRYETVDRFSGWLSQRLETEIVLDQLNVSPPARSAEGLTPDVQERLDDRLSREYEIYQEIAE